jgi:hypothetical protein
MVGFLVLAFLVLGLLTFFLDFQINDPFPYPLTISTRDAREKAGAL